MISNYDIFSFTIIFIYGITYLVPTDWYFLRKHGVKFPNFYYLRFLHACGCLAYILDYHLQDGNTIPKWHIRSRHIFFGYSKEHASNVGIIPNPSTKRISP